MGKNKKHILFAILTCLAAGGLFFFFPEKTLFQSLASSKTGIRFINKITENDTFNVLEYMNIYTGAGVAAGDVNNDGLTDLFFAGNQTSSRLYLNKGDFKFEDITEKAGTQTNRWCTGVSMIDINQDDWLDIYINVAGSPKYGNTANLLFVNNKDGSFSEKAEEYGIADPRQTMNASFFDYDLDGDLDLFLIVNPADQLVTNINNVIEQRMDRPGRGIDVLYRNDGNGKFTDMSEEAGIVKDGYSLSAAISDINQDGWLDIYVSNDFISSDVLYINNGDGTFTDRISQYLKHTSFASMGNDVADVNNDGLPDIFVLDMLPEDNYRRKMLIPAMKTDKFDLSLRKGYEPQYTRNTLQLNLGCSAHFSEIALLSGVSSTDWSWAPLFADYDNDGDKDLLVTNGFYRDLGNLDYINYQFSQQSPMGTEQAKRDKKLFDIQALESVPLQNYLFENNGDLTFSKRSDEWGMKHKGFSNGACFADLDNDGDLDIIINELNGEALVYQNNAREMRPHHFISVELSGVKPNIQGLNAKIWLFTPDGNMQFQELNPYRGFESSMEQVLHFGLGKNASVDSAVIVWPNGQRQVERQLRVDQKNTIKYSPESERAELVQSFPHGKHETSIFCEIAQVKYAHQENYHIDFNTQILLPHQHSKASPCLATGDVNADGLDDFFVGGAKDGQSVLFLQKEDGQFSQTIISPKNNADQTAACLFDADGDGDLDLYVVNGGSELQEGSQELQDDFYENDGHGNFFQKNEILPDLKSAGGCVTAADFDRDGDLDLFVGGRIKPSEYPLSPHSFLLKNEGGKFVDITPPALKNIGMVSTALWEDMDKDGWLDLVIAGEFMPLCIFKNKNGRFANSDADPNDLSGRIPESSGWWNSLVAADFDGDGDLDLVAGNLGLNSRYRATADEPLSIYAGDFDKNDAIDPIICQYESGSRYIFPTRDELAAQIPAMKKRFPDYHSFAKATFEQSFLPEELEACQVFSADCFESSYFENRGNGHFHRSSLPLMAQFAPIQSMLVEDFNDDGYLDVLAAGNSYATEYSTGRYDAGTGCLLIGDGKGNFSTVPNQTSGFWAERDVRALAKIGWQNEQPLILVANNNSDMQVYLWKAD